MKPMDIKVKYFTDKIDKLQKIEQGGWIDLRLADDVRRSRRCVPWAGLGVLRP